MWSWSCCTGSWGPGWLAQSGLAVDGRGRVLTGADLRSVSDSAVFASGDCGVIDGQSRPPVGYGRCVQRLFWQPTCSVLFCVALYSAGAQPHALQLLGDGRAAHGPFGQVKQVGPSRRIWRWKQHLDQRFMSMLRPPQMVSDQPMACSGCAAKLPDAPLRGALQQLADGHCPPAEDAAAAGDGWLQSGWVSGSGGRPLSQWTPNGFACQLGSLGLRGVAAPWPSAGDLASMF